MESAGQVFLGTVIGFALLAGFVMMLGVAFWGLWIACRMGANAHRATRKWRRDRAALATWEASDR